MAGLSCTVAIRSFRRLEGAFVRMNLAKCKNMSRVPWRVGCYYGSPTRCDLYAHLISPSESVSHRTGCTAMLYPRSTRCLITFPLITSVDGSQRAVPLPALNHRETLAAPISQFSPTDPESVGLAVLNCAVQRLGVTKIGEELIPTSKGPTSTASAQVIPRSVLRG